MSDRPTDQQILDKLDAAENPVTRGVLKDTCVRRLREAVARDAEQQTEIERLREIALDAYRAGAIAAHEDTVEGLYNMAHAIDSDEPQEWLDDYLRETKALAHNSKEKGDG